MDRLKDMAIVRMAELSRLYAACFVVLAVSGLFLTFQAVLQPQSYGWISPYMTGAGLASCIILIAGAWGRIPAFK